ncbi:MAG: ribosome biogenesis GTP-binding protein YihA/YsxC [Nitrospiraceae bacterium]
MKILNAEFIRSCASPEQFPKDDLPELACVGRSNVGKSSLINSLLQRKGLAKVSRTPGKTRLINFFLITTNDPLCERCYVVDLPGYGYAKVGKTIRRQWGPMIERYLKGRPQLRGVILLVESRGLERHDLTTLAWLRFIGHDPVVVSTKADKLNRNDRRLSEAALRDTLGLSPEYPFVQYSSLTHEGRDALLEVIRGKLFGRERSS